MDIDKTRNVFKFFLAVLTLMLSSVYIHIYLSLFYFIFCSLSLLRLVGYTFFFFFFIKKFMCSFRISYTFGTSLPYELTGCRNDGSIFRTSACRAKKCTSFYWFSSLIYRDANMAPVQPGELLAFLLRRVVEGFVTSLPGLYGRKSDMVLVKCLLCCENF